MFCTIAWAGIPDAIPRVGNGMIGPDYPLGDDMKHMVVYFSQTGNTKKVGEVIRDAIESVTGQCDIVRLEEADIQVLGDYDLIGLGCPTFAYAEPVNVRAFIRRMGPLKGRQSFVFSTYGGHPGNVLPSMAWKLRRQGLKVIGGFNCDGWDHMPHHGLRKGIQMKLTSRQQPILAETWPSAAI